MEIEGSVCHRYKKAPFLYKKYTKSNSDFSNPYVRSIFLLFLIKHIFEKTNQ